MIRVREVTTYAVPCDCCGTKSPSSGWVHLDQAIESAREYDFLVDGFQHFCWNCYRWSGDGANYVAGGCHAAPEQVVAL